MNKFFDFIDNRAIIRRIVLFITLWMTWKSFAWATVFAMSYHIGTAGAGVDMAAVIGAVTAPIAVLQGYVFKIYVEGRP